MKGFLPSPGFLQGIFGDWDFCTKREGALLIKEGAPVNLIYNAIPYNFLKNPILMRFSKGIFWFSFREKQKKSPLFFNFFYFFIFFVFFVYEFLK